jgi:hypothetical protein
MHACRCWNAPAAHCPACPPAPLRSPREEADNPFAIPPDEDIFKLQEEQRQQRAILKAQLASMSVTDKTTFASRMQSTLNGDLAKALAKELHASMRMAAGNEVGLDGGAQHQQGTEDQKDMTAAEQAMHDSGPR